MKEKEKNGLHNTGASGAIPDAAHKITSGKFNYDILTKQKDEVK